MSIFCKLEKVLKPGLLNNTPLEYIVCLDVIYIYYLEFNNRSESWIIFSRSGRCEDKLQLCTEMYMQSVFVSVTLILL